jgi:glyoxylase-like metal-dependent hydrolase (beta-lactamase superfamily II)
VIDASVEPAVYVGLAEEREWRIRHVLDTHVHADHLSRSRRLVEMVGAKLYMPEGAPVSFPHAALADGDAVGVGSSRLTAIRTPGHTAERTSYLLDERALFTGDTLFLSAVGRPDLEATSEGAREKAHVLFGSVGRLLDLPSQILVLPGHTSEPVPFDGEPISAPLSEVCEEVGPLLEDEDRFVQKVAGGLSPTPENYERIVELNRTGEQPDGDPTDLEAGANRCAAG